MLPPIHRRLRNPGTHPHFLTKKTLPWYCSTEADSSFEELTKLLTEAPVLQYPHPSCEYIVETDASDTGVGAVLSQVHGERESVVAYYRKTFTLSEHNHCVTQREL